MKKIIVPLALAVALSACSPTKLLNKYLPGKPKQPAKPVAVDEFGKLPDVFATAVNRSGFSRTNYLQASRGVMQDIQNGDIQIVNEGKRITVIVPTDKYFIFDTAKLSDLHYGPLTNIAKLIKCFANPQVYVAGFTDDVGSYEYKRIMSKERAQAILTYLWSQGISERSSFAQGYGERFAIGNNKLIHGSALNRRVEIQWTLN